MRLLGDAQALHAEGDDNLKRPGSLVNVTFLMVGLRRQMTTLMLIVVIYIDGLHKPHAFGSVSSLESAWCKKNLALRSELVQPRQRARTFARTSEEYPWRLCV